MLLDVLRLLWFERHCRVILLHGRTLEESETIRHILTNQQREFQLFMYYYQSNTKPYDDAKVRDLVKPIPDRKMTI